MPAFDAEANEIEVVVQTWENLDMIKTRCVQSLYAV